MGKIYDFFKLVAELTGLLKILKVIEENKLSAITEKSLTKLDACINDEQVQIMKLRGLEKKREQLQNELGFGNLTFRQIIENLQGDEKKEAKELFYSLQKATDDFKTINKSVKTALEVNLYSIDSALKNTDLSKQIKAAAIDNHIAASRNKFV